MTPKMTSRFKFVNGEEVRSRKKKEKKRRWPLFFYFRSKMRDIPKIGKRQKIRIEDNVNFKS